jgi:hypothetical protein
VLLGNGDLQLLDSLVLLEKLSAICEITKLPRINRLFLIFIVDSPVAAVAGVGDTGHRLVPTPQGLLKTTRVADPFILTWVLTS